MELALNYEEKWNKFNSCFTEILEKYLPTHKRLLRGMNGNLEIMPNILMYGVYGFPLDMLWKEALLRRFNIEKFLPISCIWGKDIQYMETPYYIHIDLENPCMPRDIEVLQDFLKSVITSKNIISERHIIILENIDSFVNKNTNMNAFRVLLERFSKNVWFICTTYRIGKMESPLKSRFYCIRVPLSTEAEIHSILNYIDGNDNKNKEEDENNKKEKIKKIKKRKKKEKDEDEDGMIQEDKKDTESIQIMTRNIFLAFTMPKYTDEKMYWLSSLSFPPLYDYITNNELPSIESIRTIIYRAFQCGISISELTKDIIEICIQRGDKENDIHHITAEFSKYEHMASQSKGTRILLYMEYMLHYIMIILPSKKEKSKLNK